MFVQVAQVMMFPLVESVDGIKIMLIWLPSNYNRYILQFILKDKWGLKRF